MRVKVNGGLESDVKEKASTSKRRNFSQLMNLGVNYRLFFPLADDANGQVTIITASAWGRKLNQEILGKGVNFVKLSADYNKDGNLHDNSGIAPFARIARVIFDADYKYEVEQAQDRAVKEAKTLGKDVDEVALRMSLKELEQTYYGDKDAKPNPVYATKAPAIGNQTLEIATECLVVPLDTNSVPEWNKAEVASLPLTSNTKIQQLRAIYTNPDFCDDEQEYLEVSWNYSGTTKAEAGRSACFTGVSKETSLARKFPELWEANKGKLADISLDPETIASKNWTLSTATPVKEVVEKFKSYLLKRPILFPHIDFDADITKAAAKDIIDLGVTAEYKNIQEQLLALVNEDATADDSGMEVSSEVVEKTMNLNNLEDVQKSGVNVDDVADQTDIDNL